jgi:hypothetical protein
VTTEQTIVLGVLAAAFVAGWGVRALIGHLDRKSETSEAPIEEGVDRAVEESRQDLDRAIRSYVSALATSISDPAPAAEQGALADEVSSALQDDAANESMIAGVNGDEFTERELDLADWGFAYGVAWARARERSPADAGDAVARDARQAAESVFRDYVAEARWAKAADAGQAENGEGPAPPPEPAV